jgi:hypothetical protein
MTDREIMIRVYGLLWRSASDESFTHKARAEIREVLTRDEQRDGVAWVIKTFGGMSTSELIAADMLANFFPDRSFP